MNIPNLGFLFNKHYYINEKLEFELKDIHKKNRDILKVEFKGRYNAPYGKYCFRLKTIYPGMIIGIGYQHDINNDDKKDNKDKEDKDCYKMGFYFDYTTGMPIIPGSTVKGLLRSAFKHREYILEILKNNKIDFEKEKLEKFKKNLEDNGKENYINYNLSDDDLLVNLLEYEIFEIGTIEGLKDIFYEAYIHEVKGNDGKFLADDYITPHYNNPLKNPIPLKFIKILPDVVFKFSFDLNDGILNSFDKLKLFRQILLDLGIGAKTNVGYGKFDEKYGENDILNLERRMKKNHKKYYKDFRRSI
ncbi:CRISPR-associated protein Cmr6 [Caloranaerobacter azorensis DSM 13643]|uniref:CRISPR-associated protein Cmr6 n=1 Tax=Caloranaerobacter azorensis DSM 13643 TaxID=1121264 RepID=A0A1M5UGV8_9FIRM|nr:type III-B CRISPR module RAMP protein Cmr6 [Caloranaerobacter azorensis]SHH62160.1 CRISPR-associated protein Cmr6 [Caloranaerobacter azorensis DSM 13643]